MGSAAAENNLCTTARERSPQVMRNGNNLQKPHIAGFLESDPI